MFCFSLERNTTAVMAAAIMVIYVTPGDGSQVKS
jgi:hypothetical protein